MLQEKLSTRHYAPDNKRFSEVVFINFAQSLACFAWAGLYLLVTGGLRSAAAPSLKYWRVGISNTIGPALGVIALKNIRCGKDLLAPPADPPVGFTHLPAPLRRAQLHRPGPRQVLQDHPGHARGRPPPREALQAPRIPLRHPHRRRAPAPAPPPPAAGPSQRTHARPLKRSAPAPLPPAPLRPPFQRASRCLPS